jgi:putative toxin-antitoxin system antitoxin component (TIGR02293 family)
MWGAVLAPLLQLILKEEYDLAASQLPIARIVPVVAHAVAVFGDEHKASHWLSTPLPLLENHAPSELLNSDEGIQRVDEILTRIEHNIFS